MIDATPVLRALAARRIAALERMDPVAAQRRTLGRLLRRAADTRFGREHGFAEIDSVREFQQRVKLRRYEAFWSEYWRAAFPELTNVTWPGRVPAFALSSGTTGATSKRIPVSRAMLRANEGAAFDALGWHFAARPGSRVFGGRNLMLGGSTALERLAPGVVAGDLSGIAASRMPLWTRPRVLPPRALALIGDWERKVAALAQAALREDIRSISGTPSWMLLFFQQLASLRPDRSRRLAEYFSNLELIVHGGVAFAPYRDAMSAWLEGSRAETREVYAASEGFIAAADRGPGEGLRMVLDRGLFFEFVRPEEIGSARPDRRWLATAELDVEYALVLSSNAGLWSYVIGDTVRLIERDPARVLVTGRTGFTLSAFGEHLSAAELDEAVADAAQRLAATVVDYAAAALYPSAERARGGHVFIVELSRDARGEEARFGASLDAALAGRNADYADHRRGDFGMAPPKIVLAPPGSFVEWMRSRGKLGGQNKVPRVIDDRTLLDGLLRAAGGHHD